MREKQYSSTLEQTNSKSNCLKQTAIIGPTASGKSDLALKLATSSDSYILSLDSLSVYKEIDIVSAKPTPDELALVPHYGINEIYPNEPFNAMLFANIYTSLYTKALQEGKDIIIVGGTSFYLKALIDGLSKECPIENETKTKVAEILQDMGEAYKLLETVDPLYASTITHNDTFRITKALEVYYQSGENLSTWFKNNPKTPIIKGAIDIINIDIEKQKLHEKIELRTKKMVEMGLINEVQYLLDKYTTEPNCMKSIGIKETIEYLDGGIESVEKLIKTISQNTKRLAKRQTTFNRTQFESVTPLSDSQILYTF